MSKTEYGTVPHLKYDTTISYNGICFMYAINDSFLCYALPFLYTYSVKKLTLAKFLTSHSIFFIMKKLFLIPYS